MTRRSILYALAVLAASALAGPAAAAKPPKPVAGFDCAKVLSATQIGSVLGTTYPLVTRMLPKPTAKVATASCVYGGNAVTVQVQTYQTPAAALANYQSLLKTYKFPNCSNPDPRGCAPQPVAGIGQQAVEFANYLTLLKGNTWVSIGGRAQPQGGFAYTYDQLEAMAQLAAPNVH